MHLFDFVINYVIGFKPYVLLPLLLFTVSLAVRIPIHKAIKSALTIGIGFIGIFIIFDFFVGNIGPAVQALTTRTGLHFNILDVGWTPLAAITWSYKLAPLFLILIIAMNILMLMLRLTKTINVDIWNYWHFIFIGILVYETTGNILLSIAATLTCNIITLKLADWSVHYVERFSSLSGISISTLSGMVYFPIGLVGDFFLDRVPYIKNLHISPETIKKKLGIAGEPIVIGFIVGAILGIGGGYEIKKILELAFEIAAVILILPNMTGILGQGLIPISEGLKVFIKNKFPNLGETYIGLDLAIILGNPSVIVTAVLLTPVAILLAFLLPGVKFIPLGDLANIMGAIVMIVVSTKGNILRAFLISIPIFVGHFYIASAMADTYTILAHKASFSFNGYQGIITSFLDGGNLFKFWIFKVFDGNLIAFSILPVIFVLLYFTKKVSTLLN